MIGLGNVQQVRVVGVELSENNGTQSRQVRHTVSSMYVQNVKRVAGLLVCVQCEGIL